LEHLNEYLATYGYIFLFFYSLGGGFLAIIAATVLAYAGKMDIYIVFLVSIASNLLGDILLFYMGRFNKKDLYVYAKGHKRKIAYSILLVRKYGTLIVFTQKFIYGLKTIIPMVMGFSKYNFFKFIFYNIFASIIFISFVVSISFYSSEFILEFVSALEKYPVWMYPLILFSILFIFWQIISKATKK
jgi:membrane protein DedA with SNARE-associated domain